MNIQNRTPYLSVNHLEVNNFDLGNDAIQSIQNIVDNKLENSVVSQSGLTASHVIIGEGVNRDVLSSGLIATGGLHESLIVPGTLSVVGKITVNSSSDNSFSLPVTKGASNQILYTDGAGNTSWMNIPFSSQTQIQPGINMTLDISGDIYILNTVPSPSFTDLTATGTVDLGVTTVSKLNGFTIPIGSGLPGTYLYTSGSGDTSWSSWALPASTTLTTGKMLIATSATAMDLTAYTVPTTAGTNGGFWQSNGTNMIASAFALPTGNGTNGQLLSTDGAGTTSWTTLDPSTFAVGCLPLVIKPLGYTTKSLPGPPFNNTFTTYYQSYQGSALESFQFSLATTLAFGSGHVDYTIKRVTGPVRVNLNSKLTNWQSNGGGAYPSGARMRLQHINVSNVTVDLFTITKSDISSDTWFTDDPAHASPSINLSTTFTGSDILRVILDGAGNTTISVNVYNMTIY